MKIAKISSQEKTRTVETIEAVEKINTPFYEIRVPELSSEDRNLQPPVRSFESVKSFLQTLFPQDVKISNDKVLDKEKDKE